MMMNTLRRALPRLGARAFHTQSSQVSNKRIARWGVAVGAATIASFAYSQIAMSEAKSEAKGEETIEAKIAQIGDLKDGEMKEVQIGDTKALLTRIDGKYYATGLKCTHFGAPLNKGVLNKTEVVCPWHNASFSVVTGKATSAPALDDLPVYQVRIEGSDVFVTVPKKSQDKVVPGRVGHRCACSDDKVFAIIGGGAAAVVAAQTLRQDGFKGRVVMITKEDALPYDRTLLSKMAITKEKALLRDEAFYKLHDIEVMRGVEVKELDAANKKISMVDGSSLTYDKVLLASGANPRRLGIPGDGQGNVLVVRALEDNKMLQEAADAAKSGKKKAVVIGTSFIGMETAAFLRKNKGLDVTVIGIDDVPFQNVLGPVVGGAFKQLHETNGVVFKLGRQVKEITGSGSVTGVVLDDGQKLEADLVVMGVGVQPTTPKLQGITKDKDGGISVDDMMQVVNLKAPAGSVFAAGDIARFPYSVNGDKIRVEHWNVAQDQGRVAAHNMAGQNVKYHSVPFFWTMQFGVGLRYAGHVDKFDEVIVEGDVEARKFQAYYIRNGKVGAFASMGRDPVATAAVLLLQNNKMPSVQEIRKGPVDLVKLAAEM